MFSSDYKIEKLLELELRIVNKHLPIQRIPIEELLKMEFPCVKLRDGTLHTFKKAELEKLRTYLSDEEAKKLLLPIIIILRPDIGEGAAIIEDSIAAHVVAKILDIRNTEINKLVLYRPHVAYLRRFFDTIFQFAISINLSEEEPQVSFSE